MAKIAIFTGPEGHLSIAQSLNAALQSEKHTVSTFFDRHILFDLYTPIYQLLPAAHQVPYKLSQFTASHKLLKDLFRQQYLEKILDFCKKEKPDIFISTYFMFNSTLDSISDETKKPFINVVADPKTIHPLFVSSSAVQNFVFDENAADSCKLFDAPSTCTPTGWFVKPEFEQPYDQRKVRTQLGLKQDLMTLLISSGSEGTTMVMKLLPFLVQSTQPLQIIIACGNNKTLYKSVLSFQSLFKRLRKETAVVPLSFVTNMHQYMQAADLVVGKAGPNSLFESVATKTPFFAITHISGQEDGNLDIILDHNLGYVEENPFKAQVLLSSILENPEQLEVFQPSLKKMAEYNKKSKKILLKTVADLAKS